VEETDKNNALLFSTQCCALAHTVWSQNRSLVNQDELVELLVQHAELCVDMVNILNCRHFCTFECALYIFTSYLIRYYLTVCSIMGDRLSVICQSCLSLI